MARMNKPTKWSNFSVNDLIIAGVVYARYGIFKAGWITVANHPGFTSDTIPVILDRNKFPSVWT